MALESERPEEEALAVGLAEDSADDEGLGLLSVDEPVEASQAQRKATRHVARAATLKLTRSFMGVSISEY
jgi:hypothetical protein